MSQTFIPLGIDGAGFQNSVCCSPDGNTQLYAGDVAGIHQSRDRAITWRQANRGLLDKPDAQGGAVLFETNSVAYYCAGSAASGGFYASSNADAVDPTWTQVSSGVAFRVGNLEGEFGLPQNHPRAVGRLMTLGGASGVGARKWLYMASFRDGVYRTADGVNIAPARIVGTAGSNIFLRGLATDPSDDTILYAAAYNGTAGTGGLYKVINANASATWSKMTTPFDLVEEVLALGAPGNIRIYVVGSNGATDGVWKFSGPNPPLGTGADTWTNITPGPTNANYCSIEGFKRAGQSDVIWVGCSAAVNFSGNLRAHLFRSTDAGSTFQVMPTVAETATTSSKVKNTMGDAGGDIWWHYAAQPGARLGTGSSVVASAIAINPVDEDEVYIAGRGGGWVSHDAMAASPTFYPAVHNLEATINPACSSDPNVLGRVIFTNVDWGVLYSTDYGSTFANKTVGMSGVYSGVIGTSTTPGAAYVGGGNRDTNDGGSVKKSTNFVTSAFNTLGSPPFTGRVMGIDSRDIGGVDHLVMFAAADGIYYWNGSTYAKRKAVGTGGSLPGNAASPANKRVPCKWVNDNLAYMLDPQTGLWRGTTSSARLDTWTKVWTKVSSGRSTNYLCVDPADPGRVFVSVTDGFYRLDNVDTSVVGSGATANQITNISNASCTWFDTQDRLFVIETQAVPTCKRTTNLTSNTPTWTDDANEYFKSAGQFPNWVDGRSPGITYFAGEGTGAMFASGLLLSGIGVPININIGVPTIVGGQGNISPPGNLLDIAIGVPTITGGTLGIAPPGNLLDIAIGVPTVSVGGTFEILPPGGTLDIAIGTPTIQVGNKPGRRRPHHRRLRSAIPGIGNIRSVGG